MSQKPRPQGYTQRRRNSFREQYERILIVCEGTKTEPQYFNAMKSKLHLISLVVAGKHCKSEPDKIIKHAIELKKKASESPDTKYEHVWCILDVEAPNPHASLEKAISTAKANDIKLALSNPCFEYWYILHFEKTGRLFHKSKDVERELKTHYSAYKKNSKDIFAVLYPRTDTAIQNAKNVLSEKRCSEDLRKHNPSTHVHRIVEHLLTMSRKPTDK